MKKAKKLIVLFTAVIALCLLFAVSSGVKAEETVESYDCIINGISKNCKTVEFACTALPESYKYELALFDYNKKRISTVTCDYKDTASAFSKAGGKCVYAVFSNKTAKNKIYYYNVRVLKYDGNKGKYAEEFPWSESYGMFNTISNYKMKANDSKRSVAFTMPKVAGVYRYRIFLSSKKTSGYKQVKAVKPGKKYTLSKYNGKKFKLNKKYYVIIRPCVKDTKSYGGLNYSGYIRFIRK